MNATTLVGEVARLKNEGAQAYQRGDWESAQRFFEQALRLDPLNAPIWSNLGAALRMRRAFYESLACYQL